MAEQDGPQPPSGDTAETRREGERLRRTAAPESGESRPSPDPPGAQPAGRRGTGRAGAAGRADRRCRPHLCAALRHGGAAGAVQAPLGLSLPLPARPPAPRVSSAPSPGDRPPPRAPWSARSPAPPTRRRCGQPMGIAAGGATHWLSCLSLSSTAAINGAVSQSLP